jgi:hypothetical protein
VIVLFSVVLGTTTWLATGGLSSGERPRTGSTDVVTDFETGSWQGWSVETGSASVSSGPGENHALHIRGTVERSFSRDPIDAAQTLLTLDLDGVATVTIHSGGIEVVSQTVERERRWRVPTRSTITVRIAGSDIRLQSAQVRTVFDSSLGARSPTGRWSA